MIKQHEYHLPEQQTTLAMASELAQACHRQSVFYLLGELGVGKTTFCRGFLQALGHSGIARSPTYTLVESYRLPPFYIYHFDLYRLHDAEELESIGIRDYDHANALFLIEWPQQGAGFLPAADLTLHFSYQALGRHVVVTALSLYGEQLLQQLNRALR